MGQYVPVYVALPSSGGGNLPTVYNGAITSPPVSGFGYTFPVIEERHHFDINYFESSYWQDGVFSGGNYNFSNFSIDVINQYSWFGNTSTYHVSSSSGYGSWFSAPGYNTQSGHYWTSESAGVHTNSIFGSSDSFVFRNTESDYSHLQVGSIAIDNSHLEIHEGAGVQVDTILASMDNFAFRDTVIDTSNVQFGNTSFNSMHSVVSAGSQTSYSDIFGASGHGQTASIEVHDQWSQQGPGYYESHASDYSMHSSDVTTISMPSYMMSMGSIDDMSLLLGMGGGKG